MADEMSGFTFNRVTVIGTGLIGCSVAALLKGRAVAGEVVGVDSEEAHLEMARRLGFIDRGYRDPARGVMGSEAVVLAVPLDEVFRVMDAIGPDVRPGAVITCTAGTTARLRAQLVRHVRSAENFVPSFPLVHLKGSGAGAGSALVLTDQHCLVAVGEPMPGKAVEQVCSLWRGLGMRVTRLDFDRFEAAVAGLQLWPEAVAVAAGRVAGRGDLPEGRTALSIWLADMAAPARLDRCHQLYASRLCALLGEMIEELNDLQRSLGGRADG